jgi:hypothetical protein
MHEEWTLNALEQCLLEDVKRIHWGRSCRESLVELPSGLTPEQGEGNMLILQLRCGDAQHGTRGAGTE